jgi:branched-chain amino acid transport system substrate-binding protein
VAMRTDQSQVLFYRGDVPTTRRTSLQIRQCGTHPKSHTRSLRPRTHLLALVSLVVSALIAASCTSTAPEAGTTTVTPSSTSTTTTMPRSSDGQVSIGVLLPSTGSGAQFGSPLISTVRASVEIINEAGGILGQPVLLVEADEGGTPSSAAAALDSLLGQGVDAIIGPASSLNALAIASTAVAAGIPMCSPTATAIALDDFPDNGLFFRTVPSDSLQAVAIAKSAELTGNPRVAMTYIDDVYGRAFARAVNDELALRNLQLVNNVAVSPTDSDLSDNVVALFAEDPGVIIVIADADTGARILAEIGANVAIRRPTVPRILVNDAIRMARSTQLLRDLPNRVRTQILGISPLAVPVDASAFNAPFAAHAHDCVNLVALAAERAGSDDPVRIANGIVGVSVGGSVCTSFEDCRNRLELGLQIDYVGASGPLRLSSRTGDPTVANFQRFTFDNEGRDISGSIFDATTFRPSEF